MADEPAPLPIRTKEDLEAVRDELRDILARHDLPIYSQPSRFNSAPRMRYLSELIRDRAEFNVMNFYPYDREEYCQPGRLPRTFSDLIARDIDRTEADLIKYATLALETVEAELAALNAAASPPGRPRVVSKLT